MAKTQIDLSGSRGLAARFHGDKPYTSSKPNLRYLGSDGQFAEGVFNPISVLGYMSPANDTTKAVSGTTSFLLTSALVYPEKVAEGSVDSIFFADEATTGTAGQIVNLDSAVDTSLDSAYTIPTFEGYRFEASTEGSTDIVTVESTTVDNLGLSNADAVTYLGITGLGLTNGTTYYVGNISGDTFKLYEEVGLSTLVDITGDLQNADFTTVFGSTQYGRSEDFMLYQRNGAPAIFFTRRNTTTAGSESVIMSSTAGITGGVNTIWSEVGTTDATPSNVSGADPRLLKGDGRIVFVLADNSFLYVLNDNLVHKIDGTPTGGSNGTITANVLQFLGKTDSGGSNTITHLIDGIDLRGRMWMGLHVDASFSTGTTSLSSKAMPMFVGVYVWNRISTVASIQDFIPIKGAKELKSMHIFQGQPACFTMSTDGYTQFRVWSNNRFKVVKTLGKNAYPAYRRHSVYEDDERIFWLGNDGKVYLYGKVDGETSSTNELYIIGDMTGHVSEGETYSASGVLVPANATETVTSGTEAESLAFYISFSDTGGNHLKKWYPFGVETIASNAQNPHTGSVYSLVRFLPDMTNVNYVDIRCAPVSSTGSTVVGYVKYYFNQSSTAAFTKSITLDQASRGYVRHEINKQYVNAIQIEIEWNTSNTLGVDVFKPSVAIIDYDDTETKG